MSKVFFYVMFALSLALTAFLGWSVVQTHLLANQLVLIGAAVLALIPMLLYLLQREKKGKNKKTGFRIAAIVLLLFMSLVEGAVGFYVHRYNSRMDEVTEVRTQYTEIKVYVKKDADNPDRQITIEYAVESKYVFGTISGVDAAAIDQTRQDLERKYGRTIQLRSYGSLQELVRALDEGEVDALLISTAYFDLIDSLPDYEGYTEKLYVPENFSSRIQTEIMPQPAVINPEIQEDVLSTLQDPALWENSFCAYLSGIDTYGPVTARSRSDVNILMAVNPQTRQILLLNTPRDYYIPNPAGGGQLDKLTHLGIYGIDVSMKGLADLYQEDVDYYGQINFTGFETLIDAIGGITVDSPQAFEAQGYSFSEGPNTMDGAQALAFARERHSFSSGDNERGRNQMRVITAVIQKITGDSTNLLLHYNEVLDSLQGMFVTNLTSDDIASLVKMQIDDNRSWNVKSYAVTGTGGSEYTYSMPSMKAYVMYENKDMVQKGADLIDKVMNGETLSDSDIG